MYGGKSVPIEQSKDGGKRWVKIGEVRSNDITYSAWGSRLFVDKKDRLYFVYSSHKIYFSKSDNYGKAWSLPILVSDKGDRPEIFVSSKGTIYVGWYTGRVKHDIHLAISSDGGNNWSSPERLRQGKGLFFTESDDGVVYLGYVGGKGNMVFYFSSTKDRGKTWQSKAVGQMLMPIKEPYLKVHKGIIYFIYKGLIPTISGLIPGGEVKYNIYLKVSKDGGERWEGSIKLDQK